MNLQTTMLKACTLIVVSVLAGGCATFKSTADFETTPEAKLRDEVRGRYDGSFVIDLRSTKELKTPVKRVAMISFYVLDPGSRETQQGWLYTTVSNRALTRDGASAVAAGFHDASIGPMKAAFADRGIELVTPEALISSPNRWNTYNTLQVSYGLIASFFNEMNEFFSNPLKASAVAPGYRFFPAAEMRDGTFAESIGKLCTVFDAQALVIMGIEVKTEESAFSIRKVLFGVYGPNPNNEDYTEYEMYKVDFDKETKGSILGFIFNLFTQKPVRFATLSEDGRGYVADYKGFDKLAAAIAGRAADFLKEGKVK